MSTWRQLIFRVLSGEGLSFKVPSIFLCKFGCSCCFMSHFFLIELCTALQLIGTLCTALTPFRPDRGCKSLQESRNPVELLMQLPIGLSPCCNGPRSSHTLLSKFGVPLTFLCILLSNPFMRHVRMLWVFFKFIFIIGLTFWVLFWQKKFYPQGCCFSIVLFINDPLHKVSFWPECFPNPFPKRPRVSHYWLTFLRAVSFGPCWTQPCDEG